MKRLKKEFIDRLPKCEKLNLYECDIEVIESDSFSNMQQLSTLDLSRNRIVYFEENVFSKLKNLQTLDLSYNKITKFDPKFIGLRESAKYSIKNNTF